MPVTSTTRKTTPFVGNDAADTFAFTFKVFSEDDLLVIVTTTATGDTETLTQTTDYTVTLNADQDDDPGGSITLVAGNLATGYTLVIASNVAATQEVDLTAASGFYPEVITDALDRLTILAQQLAEELDRVIKVSTSETIDFELPSAIDRADKFLAFDDNGDLIATAAIPGSFANSLSIGTVTNGTAAATITGTAPNQVLNLVLPTGATGPAGPQGVAGSITNSTQTDVTATRAMNTVYQNTSGNLMLITVELVIKNTTPATLQTGATDNPTTEIGSQTTTATENITNTVTFPILPDYYYRIGGGGTQSKWIETTVG